MTKTVEAEAEVVLAFEPRRPGTRRRYTSARARHERVASAAYGGPLSPVSNGMAEAFVKTFRRDYLYLARLDGAATVLRQLGAWFHDYRASPPSRLGMRSPRQYRAQLTKAA